MTTYQFLNSPLVIAVASGGMGLLAALVGVVFRLGMLISDMKAVHREMADDIRAIREDKDVMRWSVYGAGPMVRGSQHD